MRSTSTNRAWRGGFTLVELTVVILIISMLLLMAVPSVNKAITQARRDSSFSIIKQLDSACLSFQVDHEFYPMSGGSFTGSQMLRLQLTGYGPDEGDDGVPVNGGDNSDLSTLASDDGVFGLGFRKSPQGRIYGPYGSSADMDVLVIGDSPVFVDAFDNEIFYYRYEPGGYDNTHNSPADSAGTDLDMSVYAQKGISSGGSVTWNGLWRADFLLFSAGADGQFVSGQYLGASDNNTRAFHPDVPFAVDDITNFVWESES